MKQKARNLLVEAIPKLREASDLIDRQIVVRVSKNFVVVLGFDGETYEFSLGEDELANTTAATKAAQRIAGI